ncbi:tetratricopeptide repeat protein [Rhizobacter sp. AJA081-3]|jgi:tetratricopeptide (TPR) repeat protein|uniref:tetratricopeptide repeat protein n=1 Tax=Rhizobacter sp. AJA081-3 TaxID=2753607 RepID=UPI001AE06789|nr:tetratricopeptide repeat protein [Rhizobacter sp. AJA081-3]QTN23599.1 tetratricopeptide repeat protein [Rhizobacter sp. AJA081-3]
MRSAELLIRSTAVAALAALAGCSTLGDGFKAIQDTVVTPVAKAITPAAPASAASAAAAPAPVKVEAPVPPAAQRSFDEALRALRAGRTDDAERGFKALAQSNPELGGPHANLGVIYRNAGKLPESAAALERAVKASPEQPVYFNQLGITYRYQGQFTKSRAAYERAIELDANYAAAHLNLGILFDLYLRDSARAMESYERYMALSGGKDATVAKWVADLKNRKPPAAAAAKKEQS